MSFKPSKLYKELIDPNKKDWTEEAKSYINKEFPILKENWEKFNA